MRRRRRRCWQGRLCFNTRVPRIVRCGLIQAGNVLSPDKASLSDVREAMIAKHMRMIEEAAARGVQVLGLQELF